MPLESDSEKIETLAEQSITVCFEEAVKRFSGNPALSWRYREFSYDELNRHANRLAHAILQKIGTEREPVVLMTEQNASAVVGLLAILKAGKICVPINPINNEARMLDTILAEVKPRILVTTNDHMQMAQQLSGRVRVLDGEFLEGALADTNPGLPLFPDDLAFIIYTSGSTGMPKGVLHNHRNILHRIFWYAAHFHVGETDRTMMLSAGEHISGVVGMLRPLITGGNLAMFSIRHEGFAEMGRKLTEQGITILPIVNSVFRRFIDEFPSETKFSTVRLIIIGGEAAQPGDIERYRRHFSDNCLLLNTLGCTELPTYRYFVIDKQTILPAVVPAGYAVPGIETIIVGADGSPVENGHEGEIVVRSKYLALGYWNRPAETSERFSMHEDGSRAYHTGDLGKLRDDGVLEHTGRKDWLIKILGNRVELTEIENTLRLHPDIRETAVTVWQDETGELQLCAYVVPQNDSAPWTEDLKTFLRARLPDYMVPIGFKFVGALPLTQSGKLNRRALASPDIAQRFENRAVHPPRTQAERRIAKICRDVLRLDEIGVHENLFDLGANSLVVMQIMNRLQQEFALNLPVILPFDSPTVSMLARDICRVWPA